jgi:phosphoglycolate phosphatase-like HAD superfamily hydrolase
MLSTLVLFDIDGTLLLTAGAGRRAITEALGDLIGTGEVFDRVRFDGKTDPQIVTELLEAGGHHAPRDAAIIDTVCQRYLGLLAAELLHPRSRTTVMPGVLELIAALEAEPGVMLGLVTGNMAEGAALKLRAGGIAPERFKVGAYGSDSAHRPDLPPIAAGRAAPHFGRTPRGREVVIIGDTPADVTCGRSIEARAIGVATGAYPVAELAGAGAHLAVADLRDTARIVEAILGE